jgi:CubicO group peptidase (beta-lactamase class C family)
MQTPRLFRESVNGWERVTDFLALRRNEIDATFGDIAQVKIRHLMSHSAGFRNGKRFKVSREIGSPVAVPRAENPYATAKHAGREV